MVKLTRRSLCVMLCAAMLSTACSRVKTDAQAPLRQDDNNVWVILMGGQSNMAGAGDFDKLPVDVKDYVKGLGGRVSVINKGGEKRNLQPEYSEYQLEKRGFGNIFGPEMLMGARLAQAYPERKFLILKTAHGGTSLYGAWNPEWSKEKALVSEKGEYKQNLPLYANFLSQIQTALGQLDAAGETYEIKGFGWFQGENDSNREVTAKAYKHLMPKLIASYRKDLNAPDLPFVLGQVNNSGRRYKLGVPMVRKAIANTAEADSRVTMIPTSTDKSWADYPKHDDNVHYNSEGQKRLGEAYAAAFIDFWGGAETP